MNETKMSTAEETVRKFFEVGNKRDLETSNDNIAKSKL